MPPVVILRNTFSDENASVICMFVFDNGAEEDVWTKEEVT
jgi:hypothetical protein